MMLSKLEETFVSVKFLKQDWQHSSAHESLRVAVSNEKEATIATPVTDGSQGIVLRERRATLNGSVLRGSTYVTSLM